jgi:ribosomal protein S18 acetylase RimI-like enzyme
MDNESYSPLSRYFDFLSVSLERMTEVNIPEVVALINPAYSYQEALKGEPRTNPQHLKGRMAETDFYVARQKGKIVGCVYIEPKGSRLHFGLLTVAPELRGKGLAQAMMKAIEDYAREAGFKELDLDYMSAAPWLKGYYERYGFRQTGKIKPWGTIDLLQMVKELKIG